ncbi:MAG: CoA transferase [Pseudomonadales bacterium]|nr:CoA transferase [Pseudomonadales bacterium]
MNSELPMLDITVVELGTSLAAPWAGFIMGQMGATVIKVEQPDGGDPARSWGPPIADETSVIFQVANRGKHSVVLDLTKTADLEALKEIVSRRADVFIQNLRPGAVDKLGLDAGTLLEMHPELVYCNLGAYGSEGPLADRPGYDPLIQAFSGMASVTGPEDGEPCRVGVPVNDFGTGMWAVMGVQAGLMRRSRTGKGGLVDVSLLDTALGYMSLSLTAAAITGKAQGRHGLAGPGGLVPNEGFETADGVLIITAGTDAQFAKLCAVLDHPEWAQDERFNTAGGRHRHASLLRELLSASLGTRTRAQWMELLDARGVPNSPVFAPLETLEHPQTQACGMIQAGSDGGAPQIRLPIKLDGERFLRSSHVPKPGEHNHLYLNGANPANKR